MGAVFAFSFFETTKCLSRLVVCLPAFPSTLFHNPPLLGPETHCNHTATTSQLYKTNMQPPSPSRSSPHFGKITPTVTRVTAQLLSASFPMSSEADGANEPHLLRSRLFRNRVMCTSSRRDNVASTCVPMRRSIVYRRLKNKDVLATATLGTSAALDLHVSHYVLPAQQKKKNTTSTVRANSPLSPSCAYTVGAVSCTHDITRVYVQNCYASHA